MYSKAKVPMLLPLTADSHRESVLEGRDDPSTPTFGERTLVNQTAIQGGLTVKGFSTLLQGLWMLKRDVPRVPRTLLGTPRQTPTTKGFGGEYEHFELEKGVQMVLEDPTTCNCEEVLLQIDVDSLIPFLGSSRKLWSIQCHSVRRYLTVLLVGIYCGKSKPAGSTTLSG